MERWIDLSFCLCLEVSHRQGLLHSQGTVDHRADLPQRPAGHHRGKEDISTFSTHTVCFCLVCCRVPAKREAVLMWLREESL